MAVITQDDVFQRIIWSADVRTPDAVRAKLEQIGHPISVKLDRAFMRRNGDAGDAFALELQAEGINVFNDAKLIEIPTKLEELAEIEIEKTNAWMLNCMAGCLSTGLAEAADEEQRAKVDGLKLFADVCNGKVEIEVDGVMSSLKVRSCAVTVLTSKDGDIVHHEFGGRTPIEQVMLYVSYLHRFGFTDAVCSPREARAIREVSDYDAIELNCPGIRMPGDPVDDQSRTMTPGEAIASGVNRLVIGRPITKRDDPRTAVEAIAADMMSAA